MEMANFKAFVASMDEKYVYVFVASVGGVVLVLLAAFLKKVITDRRKKIRGSIMVKENDQMVRRSTREVRKATKFQVEAPEEPFTPPPSTRKSRSTAKKAPATPKTPATTSKATPKTAGGSRKARSTTKASGRASRSPSPAITRSARKKKQ